MASRSPAEPPSQRRPFGDVLPPSADRIAARALPPALDGVVVQGTLQLHERVHAAHQHEGFAEQAQLLDCTGVAAQVSKNENSASVNELTASGSFEGRPAFVRLSGTFARCLAFTGNVGARSSLHANSATGL